MKTDQAGSNSERQQRREHDNETTTEVLGVLEVLEVLGVLGFARLQLDAALQCSTDMADGGPQRGSCQEAFRRFAAAGVAAADLVDAVGSLRIELVLTAHPTEIARRTLIQKYNRIAKLLAVRDRVDLTPAEQDDSLAALEREIAAAWETNEVRGGPVSPLDEVRAGLVVFEQSLWDALPEYLRLVDRALLETTGQRLPLGAAPITFGSWIGGDRDGNPNVTPEITRQATWLARWMAAELYLREINALRSELSL